MNIENIDISKKLSEIQERESMEGVILVMLNQARRLGGIKMPPEIEEKLAIAFPNNAKINQ